MNLRNSLSFVKGMCCRHEEIILRPRILLGCGNPLIDLSAVVEKDFLNKYELKEDDAIMAEEKHRPMYDDLIGNYKVDYTPGGAAQNALRACQWVLQKPHMTVFFGCVGDDEYGRISYERSSKEGIVVRYQYMTGVPTGKCAVLINGRQRALVATLGAAECFSVSHLHELENCCLLNSAEYFYISGYFLAVSLETVLKVAKHADKNNKCFAFNLSAAFITKLLTSQLRQIIPYVDILFGNGNEAEAFAIQEGWDITDRKEIGRKLQRFRKINCTRPRIVVITQGALPVLLFQNNSVKEFEIPMIPKERFIDSNGAGDSFVGGFLAQYMLRKPLEICIKCGIYVAHHIIGQSGFNFKGKSNFSE